MTLLNEKEYIEKLRLEIKIKVEQIASLMKEEILIKNIKKTDGR